jgi:hypothetical protein
LFVLRQSTGGVWPNGSVRQRYRARWSLRAIAIQIEVPLPGWPSCVHLVPVEGPIHVEPGDLLDLKMAPACERAELAITRDDWTSAVRLRGLTPGDFPVVVSTERLDVMSLSEVDAYYPP